MRASDYLQLFKTVQNWYASQNIGLYYVFNIP